MKHSIIIPYRNRHRHLSLCLWSIGRSQQLSGRDDFEVVIVVNGKMPFLMAAPFRFRVIPDFSPMRIFNKARLLNIGIRESDGDVITFLDADAVVGGQWLDAISVLDSPGVLRCCYRVKYLSEDEGRLLFESKARTPLVSQWFTHWDDFTTHGPEEIVYGVNHGNSQFSVLRKTLADLRYDETYEGKGPEDLAFIRAFRRRYGDLHGVFLWTDPEHAMFHQQHGYEGDWHPQDQSLVLKNRERFRAS